MPELPTTSIGLIAFIVVAFGYALKYVTDQNRKTIDTFMTYIKEKNGNLERVSKEFSVRMDEVTEKHLAAMEKFLPPKV